MAYETGATSARDAKQGPPRSEGIVPLPGARSVKREGGSRVAAQGAVLHIHRRSLCKSARPIALGTKAIAPPAADRITPVPITLQGTTVPHAQAEPTTPPPTTS